ncbi:MAG: hypothetical protein ACT4P6_04875 [Gemmatimonadaceae bacterium]
MTDTQPQLGERLAVLAGPAYCIAALLVITPLGDFFSGVWPWRVAALDWRFASSGLLSGFLLTPLLGALIAIAVAAVRGSERLLRGLGVATLVAGGLCLVVLLGFVLDAVQLNSSIPAEQRRAFTDASVKALLKYVMACAAAYWLGITAYRLGKRTTPQRAAANRGTIVIGTGQTSSETAAREGRSG